MNYFAFNKYRHPRWKTSLFVFASLLIKLDLSVAATHWKPVTPVSPTEFLNCFMGVPLRIPYRLRTAFSPTVESADGHYRALVKVEALGQEAKEGPEKYDGCENTTRLYLAQDSGPFEIIFPSTTREQDHAFVHAWDYDTSQLEGMRVVDWSKDSSLLLTEAVSWMYETDGGSEYHPFIYDVSKKRFEQPPVYNVVRKQFFKPVGGLDCYLDIRSKGFDAENNLVLSAELKPPGYNGFAGACRRLPKTILYNLKSDTAVELPLTYKPIRYGRFLGQYKVSNQR